MSNVAKKDSGALAAVNFEADAGQGLNMTQEDLALPFLTCIFKPIIIEFHFLLTLS